MHLYPRAHTRTLVLSYTSLSSMWCSVRAHVCPYTNPTAYEGFSFAVFHHTSHVRVVLHEHLCGPLQFAL